MLLTSINHNYFVFYPIKLKKSVIVVQSLLIHTHNPTTYAPFHTKGCCKVEVTALHHVTGETPHDLETSGLWQTEYEGWIKPMLINLKLMA